MMMLFVIFRTAAETDRPPSRAPERACNRATNRKKCARTASPQTRAPRAGCRPSALRQPTGRRPSAGARPANTPFAQSVDSRPEGAPARPPRARHPRRPLETRTARDAARPKGRADPLAAASGRERAPGPRGPPCPENRGQKGAGFPRFPALSGCRAARRKIRRPLTCGFADCFSGRTRRGQKR